MELDPNPTNDKAEYKKWLHVFALRDGMSFMGPAQFDPYHRYPWVFKDDTIDFEYLRALDHITQFKSMPGMWEYFWDACNVLHHYVWNNATAAKPVRGPFAVIIPHYQSSVLTQMLTGARRRVVSEVFHRGHSHLSLDYTDQVIAVASPNIVLIPKELLK